MSGIHAEAEHLPNGMEAVFIHQPHWQTSSVRLVVNAGTLHEDDRTPTGVAHFFEHVTFRGTAEFPTLEALEEYSEDHFASKNAMTSKNTTTYMADCMEGLNPALNIVTQLALAPALSIDTIERERGAIIDEARASQFNQSKQAARKQMEAVGGKKYAALGTGTIEEVAEVTHQDILAFYQRHYRAANMLLIVCSNEPVETQREKAIEFIGDALNHQHKGPVLWHLPWLKSDQPVSVVHTDLPRESQTHVTVNYRIPSTPSLRDNLTLNAAGNILAQAAQKRLRRELAIAYGAIGGTSYLDNNSFGASEQYGATHIGTSTAGSDAFRCLEELINTVPQLAAADERSITLAAEGVVHALRAGLQFPPDSVADSIINNVLFRHERVVDPSRLLALAGTISVRDIQEKIKEVTAEPALIQVTSPDQKIVKDAIELY